MGVLKKQNSSLEQRIDEAFTGFEAQMKLMIKQHKSRTKQKPIQSVKIYSPFGDIAPGHQKRGATGPVEQELNLTNDSFLLATGKSYDGRFGDLARQEISPATRTFINQDSADLKNQNHPRAKPAQAGKTSGFVEGKEKYMYPESWSQ